MLYRYLVASTGEATAPLNGFATPLDFFFHRLQRGVHATHSLVGSDAVEISLRTHSHDREELDEMVEQFLAALNESAPGAGFVLREQVS